MKTKDITSKLKTYASFLETEIETHRELSQEESLRVSITEDRIVDEYLHMRTKLYKLFPEVGEYKPEYKPK